MASYQIKGKKNKGLHGPFLLKGLCKNRQFFC